VVDEEKRMRVQELRNSGQIVESRRSHDIPFGVRAIQSGITVDGIWISQSTTPIPSELKLGHLRNSSSDLVAPHDSNNGAEATDEVTLHGVRPISRQGRQHFSSDEPGEPSMTAATGAQDTMGSERPASRSYRPRRSSHLRIGSHGEYDATTLDQLEGKSPSPKKKIYTHRPRGSRGTHLEVDSSSAADNERSSGTSDDSDATLSNHPKSRSHQSLLPQYASLGEHSTRISLVASSKQVRASVPAQSYNAEYFSIPAGSPNSETSDPFATPMESPLEAPRTYKPRLSPTNPNPSWPSESAAESSHQAGSPSPFVPGELHVNRVVRKVNSGFEVLPAGTFGTPAELKGGDISHDDDSGEKRQSKLQKKPPTSITGQRASSPADRIFKEHIAHNSG
jgi:hypothetical protein